MTLLALSRPILPSGLQVLNFSLISQFGVVIRRFVLKFVGKYKFTVGSTSYALCVAFKIGVFLFGVMEEDDIMHITLQKRDKGQTWASPILGEGQLDAYSSDLEQKRLMLQRFQEEVNDYISSKYNGHFSWS